MGGWIPGGRTAGHRCPGHRYTDSMGDGREIGLDAPHVGSYGAPPMNPQPVQNAIPVAILWKPLPKGGWHAPIVLVNGKISLKAGRSTEAC